MGKYTPSIRVNHFWFSGDDENAPTGHSLNALDDSTYRVTEVQVTDYLDETEQDVVAYGIRLTRSGAPDRRINQKILLLLDERTTNDFLLSI